MRHLLAGYDLSRDRLYGHVTTHKGRVEFLAFCRYLRSLYPPDVRIAIVLDSFSPHLSTHRDRRVGQGRASSTSSRFAELTASQADALYELITERPGSPPCSPRTEPRPTGTRVGSAARRGACGAGALLRWSSGGRPEAADLPG